MADGSEPAPEFVGLVGTNGAFVDDVKGPSAMARKRASNPPGWMTLVS